MLRKLRPMGEQDGLPNAKAPLALLTAFNTVPIRSTEVHTTEMGNNVPQKLNR